MVSIDHKVAQRLAPIVALNLTSKSGCDILWDILEALALRPSRPASKPALTCFVLIFMVLRHWSSRLALRPASNCVSSYNLF